MILVTGASGFVGSALVSELAHQDGSHSVTAAVRTTSTDTLSRFPDGIRVVSVGDLTNFADWSAALQGIDAIIHCAARVHVMNDSATDPLQAYRATNVDGTLALARQAVTAGVKRFVFVSSIKVNGESTLQGQPFTSQSAPNPVDPYGVSKLEAEQALFKLADETGLEVVVVRPPLVYGPGVKANFQALVKALRKGIPLPLGAVTNNRRSLVALDNVVDLLITCAHHPAAAGHVFLASDGEDMSTAELIRRLGNAMGKPARLIYVPEWVLRAGAMMLGKKAAAQRLLGNLQVDSGHARQRLGWIPPIGVDEGLRRVIDQRHN